MACALVAPKLAQAAEAAEAAASTASAPGVPLSHLPPPRDAKQVEKDLLAAVKLADYIDSVDADGTIVLMNVTHHFDSRACVPRVPGGLTIDAVSQALLTIQRRQLAGQPIKFRIKGGTVVVPHKC